MKIKKIKNRSINFVCGSVTYATNHHKSAEKKGKADDGQQHLFNRALDPQTYRTMTSTSPYTKVV